MNSSVTLFCFCVAKFLVQSCHQISDFFPLVTSPLAEKTRSTGAVEAGEHRMPEATRNNKGYKSFCIQHSKESNVISSALCLLSRYFQFLYLQLTLVLLGLYYSFLAIKSHTMFKCLNRFGGGLFPSDF